ncbi:MauE/DoxX family redox-associated membrane protein [Pseudonocardia humida]|uniref:DoxX family membrane protein n=1 Tax=Pseudonocardia humida TaxID=2800819 RepID=A0ABT0ZTU2_9PSEU|nr:MauE/DoxX family redox-associated membrane protein [Pseudonocardia humida]MCO1654150.1 DoxX family membrane protein [Pseudonocardia humida]
MKSGRALDVIGTLARLGLAAVWLISGGLKAVDPDQTYVAVRAYDVLPDVGVEVVAALLPWVEIAFGVLLLVGVGTRIVAVLSLALLVVFVAGVVQAWARGLSIDCGCFGGGGTVEPGQTAYVQELLRDTGFALLACWLIARPRTLASLDSRLVDSERT